MPGLCIGLMSGTSLDAVDGALVDFRGKSLRTLAFESVPISASLHAELLALQVPGFDELDRAARAAIELTRLYAKVALRLLEVARTRPDTRGIPLSAVGAHGQTVRHRPDQGYTLQLIDGALLAELSDTPVVCDFRSADIAAGGQGAPLVPAFHAGAFSHPTRRRVIVNIGGIANVSLLADGEPVRGFDTGPGNVLLDHWIQSRLGLPYDRNGDWASSGRVDERWLTSLLDDPYFGLPAPKSTGRDLFNPQWLTERLARAPSAPSRAEDVQATLAELTAHSIAQACEAFRADEIFVCGGGAANAHLMRRLAGLCSPAPVTSTDALGADPRAVEAVAFAWLAECRMSSLPGSLPSVTGARGARVLGALYPAPVG
ncbi:MAG: hypothetical protein RIS35_856 [Pseudomonadota bacterium]|jgi:anhydro-N-acetylmuramic acid kinase